MCGERQTDKDRERESVARDRRIETGRERECVCVWRETDRLIETGRERGERQGLGGREREKECVCVYARAPNLRTTCL